MRWTRGHSSPYLEDRRGMGAPRGLNIGALGMLWPVIGRFGWKGILVVGAIVLAVSYCPSMMSGGGPTSEPSTSPPAEQQTAEKQGDQKVEKTPEDELVEFTGFVFDDVQSSWVDDFERRGDRYQAARIVVYREGVQSACGTTSSAVGP